MAIYAPESGKSFAKPASGKYIGTVIDVVDLGICKSKNPQFPDPVHRVQIVWLLNILGSDGKPVEYSEAPSVKLSEPGKYRASRLYEIASGILQGPIPQPFTTFDIESVIGKSNELFIVKTGEGNDARSTIAGFLPVPPGVTPPGIPVDYKRKPHKTAAAPAGQPAQPTQPAQPAQAAPQAEVKF